MFSIERKNLDDVVDLVNEKVQKMFFVDGRADGEGRFSLRANVCCSCDRLLSNRDISYISLDDLRNNSSALRLVRDNVDEDLVSNYKYCGRGKKSFMNKLLLSPRSCFVKGMVNGDVSTDSFVCCRTCSGSIRGGSIPKYSICNFMIGSAPDVLNCLSDIEMAYISPVRVFGHLFAAFGGSNAKMRGYHTFLKVDVEQIYNHTHMIDDIVEGNTISLVLSGGFTKRQKEMTMARYSIRLDRVKAALSWLRCHNIHYKSISQYDIERMPDPVITISDNSLEMESEDSNMEIIESFRVVFPDGYLNDRSGGNKKVSEFKELIRELEGNGHDISVFSRSLSQVCPDYSGNFLTAAFPKVFPYGLGGSDDERFDKDGILDNDVVNLGDYIKHVSQLSHNSVQEPLFSLVMFNINVKQSMVRNAGWISRRNIDLTSAVSELNGTDVVHAVECDSYQSQPSQSAANHLLSSVNLISRYLPHGAGAARQARGNIEALCHSYGDMCYFLTVTPDEENNIVLQVYSGSDIDLSCKKDLSKVDTSVLRDKAVLRQKLSCKYPGYSSYYFEQVVDMVVLDIIGWDVSRGKPCPNGGFFGVPDAYIGAVEEQGRSRLHIHFGVWVKDVNVIRECAFSGKVSDALFRLLPNRSRHKSESYYVNKCREFLCAEVDRISSASVLSPTSRLFKHKCNSKMMCCVPEPCAEQNLRNMRHVEGSGEEKGQIVKCQECRTSFNTVDVGLRYLEGYISSVREKDIQIVVFH